MAKDKKEIVCGPR